MTVYKAIKDGKIKTMDTQKESRYMDCARRIGCEIIETDPQIQGMPKLTEAQSLTMQWIKDLGSKQEDGSILCQQSSNTLKALEKKGYIKIIEDGGKWIDRVIIL